MSVSMAFQSELLVGLLAAGHHPGDHLHQEGDEADEEQGVRQVEADVQVGERPLHGGGIISREAPVVRVTMPSSRPSTGWKSSSIHATPGRR